MRNRRRRWRAAILGLLVATISTLIVAATAQPAAAYWRGEREYCKDYKCVHLVVNHRDFTGECQALAIGISASPHPSHGNVQAISIDGLRLHKNGVTVRDTGYLHWNSSSASSFGTSPWYSSSGSANYEAYIYQFRVRYADGYLSSNDPAKANFVSAVDINIC